MLNLLLYLPFLAPVVVAQFGEKRRGARLATYGLLVTINLALLGLAAILLLNRLATMVQPELVELEAPVFQWGAAALVCALTSMLAFGPLVPDVRRGLARWLPINPDSTVHTTALVFAIYQFGLSLGQIVLIGDLENLTGLDMTMTVWDVLLSGIPLVLFALIGVGLFVRRDGPSALERLGLRRPTWKQLAAAVGITCLLLGFDLVVNLLWYQTDPAGYDLLEQVVENIFGDLATVGGAIALGLSAGIGEELLFRGAVQPRLGLVLATTLFAIAHLQYGLTLATMEVFAIGLVLGLMRNRTNTTVCILIHAGYNTVGTLLGLWQS